MRPPLHHHVLESGLTVLLREAHTAPVAEIQVMALVGSADERPGEAGLAHFHEHMLFKGTERRGVEEIAGAVEGAGGRINAFTSFDVTCYHATVPSEAIAESLDVLADMTLHPVFDPEELAREVDVVLEEIARSEDDPHHVLGDLAFETIYQVHPYRLPILGTKESVSGFTPEKVRAFYRKWYTAENLVVVAAGDFDADALRAAVERAFADVPRGGARRERPVEPPQEALRAAVLRRPFERATLDLSWRTLPLPHPDTPLLDLLAFVLGEGESSRLVRHVKEERGLADRIDASHYTPLDPGVFTVMADAEDARVPAIVEATVRETERLRRAPVSEDELERARANFLASKHWEQESVSGLARKIASSYALAGDPGFEDADLERVRTATAADLLRVAQTWLAPERLAAAAVQSEAEGPEIDRAAVAAAVERGARAAARPFRPVHRAGESAGIVSYELEGGIRLHVAPRREVPVVALRAALLGGQLAETPERAGLSAFLAGMWLRGTDARSAADFARAVESLAADVDGFSGRSSTGLTLDATRDRWLPALDLLAEALLAPAFTAEEIERERRETLAALDRREDRLAARALDLFARTLWREHPYRLPALGTRAAVEAVDAAALRAHHARLARPDNLVLALVGDVDPDEAAKEVARRLGDLEASAEPFPLPPVEPPQDAIREAVETRDRAQAHLVVGFRGLSVHDEDRVALEVLGQTLSGQGGRLFLELRDRRGLAYTVSAAHIEGMAPGYFAVYIATSPERLEEARRGIFEELGKVRATPPSEAELEHARRHLIGNFAIDLQRSASRALHMALDARYGLGPDDAMHYPERVRAVTREDLRRVAERVLRLDAYTLAAVRPETA
ncbi:MAG: pitrilysin family protein [Myxococcota bacterium]|nr:pitrilysin family protein [Myxococcota bacterium]